MGVRGIIFKKGNTKQLTTGAKVGIAATAVGGALLVKNLIEKRKRKKGAKTEEENNTPENTGLTTPNLSNNPNLLNPNQGGVANDGKGTSVWVWVGVGAGILVLGTAAFLILRKKKTQTQI